LTPDSAPTHTDTVANDQTNRLDLLTYDPATDKGRLSPLGSGTYCWCSSVAKMRRANRASPSSDPPSGAFVSTNETFSTSE
jgi:hypothetical protein